MLAICLLYIAFKPNSICQAHQPDELRLGATSVFYTNVPYSALLLERSLASINASSIASCYEPMQDARIALGKGTGIF